METLLSILIGFMIVGALFALHARDLLSALIAQGIVGYSLVICFLYLQAPDLAVVQIVIETITLIIMVAVVLNSNREEIREDWNRHKILNLISLIVIAVFLICVFINGAATLQPFGEHTLRMAQQYTQAGAESTGSANLVTGIIFDFRGYDTLGEATILFTAALGVVTILRSKSKKES
jgi:multisubunit Na+/H+ antiporter MnhB subunit